MATLLGLHGFSLNGAGFRSSLTPLLERLPPALAPEFPDAPHACAEASVARLYAALGVRRLPPPHRSWWDASEDGRVYHDWETSVALLRERAVAGGTPCGVLGFSQGAIVAAVLAGLASTGAFPELAFVILVAGRTPRADSFRPLFQQPLPVPSLHVWGERDTFATSASPELVELFEPATRSVVTWPGAHRVPTRGAAADAIVEFIERHG